MIDSKCSKKYPKPFADYTSLDDDGYPIYKRRDLGHVVEKGGVVLNNQNVVPYNPYLLRRFQAHINVEWCNQISAIKYLFKYINKGPDRVTISIYRVMELVTTKTTNPIKMRSRHIMNVGIYLHVRQHGGCFVMTYTSGFLASRGCHFIFPVNSL